MNIAMSDSATQKLTTSGFGPALLKLQEKQNYGYMYPFCEISLFTRTTQAIQGFLMNSHPM